jgi:NAD(P)-dependent dehydrogenase (short-subunit alcohol dehydrogenase family)
MLLANKICIIVGVSSERGIGFATAKLFSEHGAIVAAVDIRMDEDRVDALNEAIDRDRDRDHAGKPEVSGYRCDIADRRQCREMVQKVLDSSGRIDCLVNCAGIVKAQSLLAIEESDFDQMMNVNLKGTFNVCHSVLESFAAQRGGSIVNVASVAAQRGGGLVGGAHYAASKGGVISLTRSIAREFGPLGVRANAICPSLIDTGMLDGNITQEQIDAVIGQIPLARPGRPSDVAGACLFLASDLSAYITGATLDVNGGSHIH